MKPSHEAPDSERGRERVDVLGLGVDRLGMRATVERCVALIESGEAEQGRPARQVSVNASKLVQCAEEASLAEFVNGSDVVSADGQAVLVAARALGVPLPERVAGIDLMEELCASAAARGWRIFILGARADVLDRAVAVLTERHPGLIVAGCRDGYFDEEQEPSVVAEIAASNAEILFVAMPSPAKERFLDRHLAATGVRFGMGVGGSVDVIAGVRRRAPRWMQRAGLEWLYRMLQEPGRMWRRYLVGNARFARLLAGALIRRRGRSGA